MGVSMKGLLLISLLSLSGAVLAASTTSSMATSIATAPVSPRLSGSLAMARSNSLYIDDGVSKVASWDFTGTLAYKLTSKLSATALLDGSQDLKDPAASDFGKGTLGLKYDIDGGPRSIFQYTPSVKYGFPVSRSANSASLKGYVTVGGKAAVNSDFLFSKKLALEMALTGTRYIHGYETGADGKANNQYGASQALTLGWNFTDALSFSFEYSHLDYWTYQGTLKEFFVHTEELGLQLNKSWTLALGHTYGNPYVSVWKADKEYNTNLTDEQNSVVYGQVTYTF